MNILSKKRWHVKNKDNAARVEADERKHTEQQKLSAARALVATQEARADLLRRKSKGTSSDLALSKQRGDDSLITVSNEEYVKEKAEAQEKLEKSIGLLTYLGQSCTDASVAKPWWVSPPSRSKTGSIARESLDLEVDAKKKQKFDPLTQMREVDAQFAKVNDLKQLQKKKEQAAASKCISAFPSLFPKDVLVPKTESNGNATSTEKSPKSQMDTADLQRSKKSRINSSSSSDRLPITSLSKSTNIDKLRAERLARERVERERAAVLMCKSLGLKLTDPSAKDNDEVIDERKLPFNSAYNPMLSSIAAERRKVHKESRKRTCRD